MSNAGFRSGIFVSYSHKDAKWLEELRTALAPALANEKLELQSWDDTKIPAGASWEQEITKAISKARVAVFLTSPDLLASDYITGVELPEALKQSDSGLVITWVPVRYAAVNLTPLWNFQAASDPGQPLAALTKANRDKALVQIANRLTEAAGINALGNTFKIIDDFSPQLEAWVKGKPESAVAPKHSVVATQEGETIKFKSATGPLETITAEDLAKLSPDSQILIRSYERTMKDLFERWVELKPKRVSRDPEIKKEATEELDAIRKELCTELQDLLNFVMSMGKSLHDHYDHIRFICQH